MSDLDTIDPGLRDILEGKPEGAGRKVLGVKKAQEAKQAPAEQVEKEQAAEPKRKARASGASRPRVKLNEVSAFAKSLRAAVEEKDSKEQRIVNLLKDPEVAEIIKDFVSKVGGVDKAYELLVKVAPDVKRGPFVKAWRECGYNTLKTADGSDDE